jgi:hypothetical protein
MKLYNRIYNVYVNKVKFHDVQFGQTFYYGNMKFIKIGTHSVTHMKESKPNSVNYSNEHLCTFTDNHIVCIQSD